MTKGSSKKYAGSAVNHAGNGDREANGEGRSSRSVVCVKNLGKKFKRYPIRWNRLLEWATANHVKLHQEHWALRGISFEVQQGESVGIIGQNGAGKSTLLKIITGTTQPTEGQFEVNGRVAAILELGMGFHPDFTGRENALMGLQVLGLSRVEIQDCLHRVIEFSELGDFIEQPLRTYSSGMHVRLAFSVATAVRPELLIVDEALSVGDAYFQHQSMKRIQRFSELGTTLLFVSHDANAVKTLCNRALLIDSGRLIKQDAVAPVLDLYQSLTLKRFEQLPARSNSSTRIVVEKDQSLVASEDKVRMVKPEALEEVSLRLLDARVREVSHLVSGETLTVEILVKFAESFADPHIGFGIRNRNGLSIYETNTYCMRETIGRVSRGEVVVARFTFHCHLSPGEYGVMVGVAQGGFGRGDFQSVLYLDYTMKLLTVLVPNDDLIWAGVFNFYPELEVSRPDTERASE